MFEQTNTAVETAADTADNASETRSAAPQRSGARLVPAVRFGLRAAVLAGVIASVGGTTTGMGGAISALSGSSDTTCCGTNGVLNSRAL